MFFFFHDTYSMILITYRDSVTAVSEFSINITKKSGAI